MTFRLSPDVLPHRLDVRLTDGKRAIAGLPIEVFQIWRLRLDPGRRRGLHFFDQLGNRDRARKLTQTMQVIFDTVHDERRAVDVAKRADHVGIHPLAQFFRLEEGDAMFCAEDNMQ